MATILSLALKVNADASGVVKNLTPAERALENLAKQASKATSAFDVLAKDSQAAADAQAALNEKFNTLAKQLQGGLNAQAYADQYAALQEEVRSTADAFAEGVRVTEQVRTAEERHGQELAKLDALLQKNAISEETHTRAVAKADAALLKASTSADKFADETTRAATQGLKFNELSGILAALPGPLGSISGRFSGIASASEGLSRVFSGGLKTGLSSLGSQLSALASPLNIGIASFAAFGAAATAITRGLADLEGRVEQLGNTALRLGTDFATIQVLDEAARRSGGSIDALAAGIQKLAVNINEARSGTGKAADAFRELGISQEQLLTLDPAALAQETAKALQAIEDPARRAALATETLGKAGLTLVPVFNAIAESEVALRRFSAAIGDIDRDRIGSLGQAFDNVKTSLAGLGQSALLPFAGLVDGVARLFADLIGTVTRLAQAIGFVLTPVLDGIGGAFSLLGDALASVNGLFDDLTGSNQKAAQDVARLRAEMEDPLEAGFVKEFANDLERINANLSNAIDESAAFGQAGFDAALRYQESIKELERQLDKELINEETFRRSAKQAGDVFKEEIAKIEQDAKLEIQVTENANQAIASIRAELSKAIDESAQFGQAGFEAALKYQTAVEELQRQFESDIINDETLARGAKAARDAYKSQVDSLKEIEQEQRKLIENDRERIGTLLAANDEATKLEQDLQTVQREQARVSAELAAARSSDNQAQADAAAARQGELDQLQAKLEEQQQALEQGFGQGFDAAFNAVNQNIDGLIAKSQQFGQAGFDAAMRLQEGIAAAQQQARSGILNIEAYRQEVQRQQELFNQEIENLEEIKRREKQARDEAAAAEKQQNADLLKAQADYRKQQESALTAYQQQQQQAQQQYAQEQARIFEEQRKAAEAEAKRQEERLRKLNTLGAQSVSVADIRNVESANLVLQLGAAAQDPALIQQRLQTKLLEKIAVGIGQASSNYFNQPVAIVGYADVGGI
jgi:hypothetical protein